MTQSGIESATFRLVTQVPHQQQHRVLIVGERIPVILWTEDRVDCRNIPDVLTKRQSLWLSWKSNPGLSKLSLFTTHKTIKLFLYQMTWETNKMQQLRFINNPLAQHVSCIIIPIFRNARAYITAHGFQHLMCTRPASRLPRTPAST